MTRAGVSKRLELGNMRFLLSYFTWRQHAAIFLATACIVICYLYIDIPVAVFFHPYQETPVTFVARFFTKFGEAQWYLVPSLLLGGILWNIRRDIASRAFYLFTTVAFSGIAVTVLKPLFSRARPKMYFMEDLYGFYLGRFAESYQSFPSGHATVFFSTCAALAVLLPRWRAPLLVTASLFSATRVVLQMHFVSDLIAGALLGILCAYILDRHWKHPEHRPSAVRNPVETQLQSA